MELFIDPTDQAIVNAVVATAHNFNLKVIAEWIETRKQLAFPGECYCEGMQGYLICPPIDPVTPAQFAKKERYL